MVDHLNAMVAGKVDSFDACTHRNACGTHVEVLKRDNICDAGCFGHGHALSMRSIIVLCHVGPVKHVRWLIKDRHCPVTTERVSQPRIPAPG